MPPTQNLPTQLLALRKSYSMGQEEFASQLGLSQGSYSDIERGKVKTLSGSVKELLAIKFGFGEISMPMPVKASTPELVLVPAKITEKERLAPTVSFRAYKGRIWFNRATIKLLSLTKDVWVAFYQNKDDASDWYISVENINGAIPLAGNSSLFGHNISIAHKVLSTNNISDASATFFLSKAHDRFWKLSSAIPKA